MLAAAVVEVGSRPIAATASVCGPIPPLAPPLAARSVHLWFRAPAITLAVQERSVRRASRRACACNACTISHPSLPPSSHSHPPPRLPSPSAYPRPARALRRRTAVVLTLGNALLRPPHPPPSSPLRPSPSAPPPLTHARRLATESAMAVSASKPAVSAWANPKKSVELLTPVAPSETEPASLEASSASRAALASATREGGRTGRGRGGSREGRDGRGDRQRSKEADVSAEAAPAVAAPREGRGRGRGSRRDGRTEPSSAPAGATLEPPASGALSSRPPTSCLAPAAAAVASPALGLPAPSSETANSSSMAAASAADPAILKIGTGNVPMDGHAAARAPQAVLSALPESSTAVIMPLPSAGLAQASASCDSKLQFGSFDGSPAGGKQLQFGSFDTNPPPASSSVVAAAIPDSLSTALGTGSANTALPGFGVDLGKPGVEPMPSAIPSTIAGGLAQLNTGGSESQKKPPAQSARPTVNGAPPLSSTSAQQPQPPGLGTAISAPRGVLPTGCMAPNKQVHAPPKASGRTKTTGANTPTPLANSHGALSKSSSSGPAAAGAFATTPCVAALADAAVSSPSDDTRNGHATPGIPPPGPCAGVCNSACGYDGAASQFGTYPMSDMSIGFAPPGSGKGDRRSRKGKGGKGGGDRGALAGVSPSAYGENLGPGMMGGGASMRPGGGPQGPGMLGQFPMMPGFGGMPGMYGGPPGMVYGPPGAPSMYQPPPGFPLQPPGQFGQPPQQPFMPQQFVPPQQSFCGGMPQQYAPRGTRTDARARLRTTALPAP